MGYLNILICGNYSFAASGLEKYLESLGHSVDCFTRGVEGKCGNVIFGDVTKMKFNRHLKNSYDIVINFIILKNKPFLDNKIFLDSLCDFCDLHAKELYQISSISVYSNDESYVNEDTEIERNHLKKGPYASLKIQSDLYLKNRNNNFNLVFLRPGYIVSPGMKFSFDGIGIKLPLNTMLLLGGKKSTLPLIQKSRFHEAIALICELDERKDCYLLLGNNKETKYSFVQAKFDGFIITLPKFPILFFLSILHSVKLLNVRLFFQIKGLFKETIFDSSRTENAIQKSLTQNSICIIGTGVYGSYTTKIILEKYPGAKITLIEAGDYSSRNESELGFHTKMSGSNYTGLSKGRWFGIGGTSVKWGGQLLFFSKEDFKNAGNFLNDLIVITDKYKDKILERFGLNNTWMDFKLNSTLKIKTGIWLGYFNRNLFKHFKIDKHKNIQLHLNTRVVKFLKKNDNNIINQILGVEVLKNGEIVELFFDHFILAAGAFESNRILLQSKLLPTTRVYFSDHLSRSIFKIKSNPSLGTTELKYFFSRSSLITKRIIGEIDEISFFANPIFNKEFNFFQNLKQFLYKGQFNFKLIYSLILDIPNVLKFLYYFIFYRELYVHKNTWHMYIDIENPKSESFIELDINSNSTIVNDLNVYFDLNQEKVEFVYSKAISQIKELLSSYNVNFCVLDEKISADKLEDTYHPYGMALSDSSDLDSFLNSYKSLVVFNTGVLPRAGGINITAAFLPIIEYYVEKKLNINE